ncbi:transcriptional regulator [Desulfocucumis palustris]|uniref:Transcriptional regulator n=1 Tax=Desulfocucumis palustris TaxID=1898651 RepID=A0A2L2XDA8_9FIRM|nr:TetR/AcrR family transcriptional regulator [Desulfocucumis palustris]GBF33703.1 transcriptional regulator [Desulfocucumis palustris]
MKTETKERIVEAATQLFETKGYHATSILEICEKAEVSKGGLFYYFKSKEDILVLIHEKFMNHIYENGKEACRLHTDPIMRLKKLIIDLVECVGEYKSYVSVFYQEKRFLSQEKFRAVRRKRDEYELIFENALSDGIMSGALRGDIDQSLMTKAIFGTCDWVYQWYNKNGPLSSREIGEKFWPIIFDGIKNK